MPSQTPRVLTAMTRSHSATHGRIVVGDGVLTMLLQAPDIETLTRLEQAFGGHLERFGMRAELAVSWDRDPA